ncbi:DUF4271 domain-containing protein [Dysgonomonas sp. 216]|uniref:DUF4271 domain-containing protein n=1 Tax=Dysgonomonas sp. 216 TaxID=2302934 RepID=UPI0013D16FB6|nr:DUF4271 domain-containing protein [Dysgonomonas sp. 216]NDW18553.1 DUF4271 domain-containing protein [Dysgonomonas sp. 216]
MNKDSTYIDTRFYKTVNDNGDSVVSWVSDKAFYDVVNDSGGIRLHYETLTKLNKEITVQNTSGHDGTAKAFSLSQVDGVFALLLLCFLFLARIYREGTLYFKENSRLVFSSRENISLFSETTITEFWYNFALVFQTIFLTAIVLFSVFVEVNKPFIPPNSFLFLALSILCIGAVELIKYLFIRLVSYLFEIKEVVNVWLRSYIIIIEMMGIIAYFPILILVYSNLSHDILFMFFAVLFIISRLIIFYRIIIFFLHGNVNFLYLIVYLCSVEIVPYFLLYKALGFLYKIDVISLLWH